MQQPPLLKSSDFMNNSFRPVTPPREVGRQSPSLQLSMKEREMALQDLHGVSDIVNEDKICVRTALTELREELNHQHSSIAIDDQELLQFLRAEKFDTQKAASRFNRFSSLQRNLFGNKQGRIKFSDLSDEDVKCLASGSLQLLPQRDRAGRAIILSIGALTQQMKITAESELRCLLFLASKAAEDENTQKNGIVVINYNLAQKSYESRNNRPVKMLRAFEDLPARVVATHFCYDNTAIKPLLSIMLDNMEKTMLCRFRSHLGQHMECQYNLMTFGIPKECLPIDATGQVDLTNHTIMLKTIQLEEEQDTSSVQEQLMAQAATTIGEKFLIPSHMDIILGRGQHAKNTPGHLLFTQLLEEHQSRYESAEKSQKTGVADGILKKLKSGGCRFVKPRVEGGWFEVSDSDGREKINHAFRNLRSTAKKATSVMRASSPSCIGPSTKKRELDELVMSWNLPSDVLAPMPSFPISAFPVSKKRALGSDVDSMFGWNVLPTSNVFAL